VRKKLKASWRLLIVDGFQRGLGGGHSVGETGYDKRVGENPKSSRKEKGLVKEEPNSKRFIRGAL